MGILDRAELLLRAERYSGSGDWLDESGNGHDAQLGSGSGSDTNDPLFKPYDGTVYTYLPGTSGNYASTADVNLLDADTAHTYQSKGAWTNGTPTADTAAFSGFSNQQAQTTSAGSKYMIVDKRAADIVSAATEYTASLYLECEDVLDSPNGARIYIEWYQTDGTTLISTSYGSYVDPGGARTQLTVTATSPALAARCRIILQAVSLGGTLTLKVSDVCLRTGSDATFVPSLRIVGDLDIEAKLAATDYTPSALQRIASTFDITPGISGYALSINTSGVLTLTVASIADYNSTAATGLTDGDTAVVRGTRDVSSGAVKFYVDGVQLGSTVSGSTSAFVAADAGLAIGANPINSFHLNGDIYYVIVRDGIDGPVVAEYRASDATEPFATHTGSVDGRTWTHNRSSSGLVSTVVDRDMFLLSTDDYFEIADAAGLDFAASEDFTVVFVGRADWDNAAERVMVAKRAGSSATAAGYYLRQGYGSLSTEIADGSAESSSSESTEPTDLTLATISSRRDTTADEIEILVNGVGAGGTTDATTGSLANSEPLRVGRYGGASGGYFEGQVVAVALFREALTDNEIYLAGRSLVKQVDDPQDLHGDALKTWIIENDSNWTSSMSTELVGLLNDLNGTTGKEYAEARATYLSVDPAG